MASYSQKVGSFLKRAAVVAVGVAAVFAAGGARAELPAGYVRLEYIQGNGTSTKILTDFTPNPTTDKIVAEVEFPSVDKTCAIWCARGSTTTTKTWTLFRLNPDKFRADYNGSTSGTLDDKTVVNTKYTVTYDRNVFTWTGGNGYTYTADSSFTAAGGPLMLFASYVNGTGNSNDNYGNHKLYSFKIYRNDTLIHDYVPCKDASGNATLCDVVDEGSSTLTRSGNFTAGLSVDRITVTGDPAQIASPSPGYDIYENCVVGQNYTFSCPAAYTNAATAADATVTATCRGWTFALANGTETSGSGLSKTITYSAEMAGATLTWNWDIEYKVTAVAEAGGTVTNAGQWVRQGGVFNTLAQTSDQTKAFYRWSDGNGTTVGRSAALSMTITEPIALTASFGSALYVAMDGTDDDQEGRGSEATPYRTPVYAYAKAVDGDTILIKAGTYDIGTSSHATLLYITNVVTITSASGRPEDVTITRSDYRLVRMDNPEAVLSSVTLHGGTGIRDSKAYSWFEPGVSARITAGTVTNCVLRNAKYGASYDCGSSAVGLDGPNARLLGCIITNNICNYDGAKGPVYMTGGLMKDCFVGDNVMGSVGYSVNGGSGEFSGGTVENCVFTRNRTLTMSAICGVKASGTAVIRDCIIWDNWAVGDVSAVPRDVWGGTASCFVGCTARIAINENCEATTDPGREGPLMEPVTGLNLTVSATRFIVPSNVTFTAHGGSAPYDWDFDGDGTVDRTTQTAETTYECVTPGVYTPRLTCGGESCYRTNLIEALGPIMYVKKGNEGAKYPYASDETAAKDLITAAGCCIDGQKILLPAETYGMSDTALIGRGVTVEGADRERTILNGYSLNSIRPLHLAHPKALATTLTARGAGGQFKGADVYIDAGTVSNCVFRDGHMEGGGLGTSHVLCTGADSVCTHCWITNNNSRMSSYSAANGIYLQNGARCSNCFIGYNIDTKLDGTVSACVRLEGNSTMENCTIVGNKAPVSGGVVATSGTVRNCVIVGNTSTDKGAGYHDVYPGYEANFVNCVVQDVDLGGTNAQDVPANVFSDYAAKDFVPAANSKLVDKGAEPVWPEATDLFGSNRVVGTAIDIGCFERPASEFDVSFTADKQEGFAPLAVTFTALASGTATETGTLWYLWDFDGDGVYEVSTTSASYEKTLPSGKVDVALVVSNGTSHVKSESVAKQNVVNVVPQVIHVVKDNPDAAFPYDTEANAAKDISTAYGIAIDGCTILVHPATYFGSSSAITLSKAVTVRGSTGNPSDVRIQVSRTGSTYSNLFSLDNTSALVADLMVFYTTEYGYMGLTSMIVGDGPQGGTVSNCVFASYASDATWSQAAVYLTYPKSLITHCVITNCAPVGSYTYAGGLRLNGGARAENCLIADCTSKDAGGVKIDNGTLVNCTVVNCRGGGIGGVSGGNVTNCVIACNVSTSGNHEKDNVSLDSAALAKYSHCASDSVTAPGWVTATTNELFRNFSARDYRPISAQSPLYRKGAYIPSVAGGVDLLGRKRKDGGKLDIGCYECKSAGFAIIVR